MLWGPAPGAAAGSQACRRDCGTAKTACAAYATAKRPALRAECTGSGKARRQCLRQAEATVRAARRACGTFKRECRTCCATGGSECDARCGDGRVTPSRGETCEPGGASCPGGGACTDDCHCPVVPTTLPPTTTSTTPRASTTTTTTIPAPGAATFAVGAGSAWFASSFVGFSILDGSASGALTLASVPTTGTDAALTIASTSHVGVRFIGDTILCFEVEATGSSGVLHCGGAPAGVDVEWRMDSNGIGPTLSSVVRTGLGGPSTAGDGAIVASARTTACTVGVAAPAAGCLAALASPADCRDPAKVRYLGLPFALPFTTATASAVIDDPRPDSNPEAVPTTAEGSPFTCPAAGTLGPEVTLAVPLPSVDLPGLGDWTSVGVLHLVRTP